MNFNRFDHSRNAEHFLIGRGGGFENSVAAKKNQTADADLNRLWPGFVPIGHDSKRKRWRLKFDHFPASMGADKDRAVASAGPGQRSLRRKKTEERRDEFAPFQIGIHARVD